MKTKILVLLLLVTFSIDGFSQRRSKKKADKETQEWKYEIECMGTGVQGTYLLKVWSYSKKPKVAIEQAKKNAVHGVIFKGFAGSGNGCSTQQPLAKNPNIENEKKVYFKDFFAEGGKYMKFVSTTTDGSVAGRDVLKISKKRYKVGVVVSVHKDLLRKDLEAAGILRGLSSGF